MIETAIGRRYAKALFELQGPADIGPTAGTLHLLAEAFTSSKDFRALLLSPVFSREQKASVVSQLASRTGCPAITGKFLSYVVSKNRIAQIREMSEAFAKLADKASNRTAVQVSSARPLSEADQAAIRSRLEQVTKGTIDLTARVDPGVIGGLEIRIGSTVYDGTVRGQLGRLRAALTKE